MSYKKLTFYIIFTIIVLSILCFFIEPFIGETLTYIELVNEGYFKYILIDPFISIFYIFLQGGPISLLLIILYVSIIVSVYKIYKQKKLFPFFIIYIILIIIYIFIGVIIFRLRNGCM